MGSDKVYLASLSSEAGEGGCEIIPPKSGEGMQILCTPG